MPRLQKSKSQKLNPNLLPVTGFNNLPAHFDHEAVVKQKTDRCGHCRTQFRAVKDFRFMGTKHFNCTRCGTSVCEKCSLYKI